jgi:hypothetical protein
MAKIRKIDFIGIGAAKCATTWVYRCLLEHPEVCGPYEKELNFFSTRDHPLFKDSQDKRKILYNKGMKSYLEYFSHCCSNSVKGEFSVSYISDPGSAKLIKDNFPDIKIIVILRDPVERAHSFYWFAKDFMLREKNKTFEDALKNNPEIYIDWGMYYEQLKPYFDLFPKENIGIFFVDDLKKDSINFMREIYKFLGVDVEFIAPSNQKKENSSSKVRYKFIRKILDYFVGLLYKFKLNFVLSIFKKIGLRKAIHFFHYKINVSKTKKPKLKTKTEKKLRNIFRKDIENLEEMIEVNLNSWK